ncbi:MAG: hypothetical protein IJV22_03235 [Bacteroidales bacterium]|nr:hypothetical protein [Bacteroidales bacterium]
MKRNHRIIWLLLVLLAPTAQAQLSTLTELNEPIEHVIVRAYTEDISIAYVNMSRHGYFVVQLPDESFITELPTNVIVHDMQICEPYLYFCGEIQDTNQGFVGFVDIQQLYDGIPPWNMYTSFNDVQVSSLKRFIVNEQTATEIDLVAIGSTRNGEPFITEIRGPLGVDTNWATTTLVLNQQNSTAIISELSDIVVTDNHIVIGAIYDSDDLGIIPLNRTVLGHNLLDIVTFQSPWQPFYVSYPHEHFEMCALNKDTIAILSFANTGNLPISSYDGFLLQVLDVHQLRDSITTFPYPIMGMCDIQNYFIISPNNIGDCRIESLNYVPSYDRLIAVTTGNAPTPNSHEGSISVINRATASFDFYYNSYMMMTSVHTLTTSNIFHVAGFEKGATKLWRLTVDLDNSLDCLYSYPNLPLDTSFNFTPKLHQNEANLKHKKQFKFIPVEQLIYQTSPSTIECKMNQ